MSRAVPGNGAGAPEVAAAAHQRGVGGCEGGSGVDHDVAFAELAGQGQVGRLHLKRRAFAQVALPGGPEGEGDVGRRRDPVDQRRGEVGGAVGLAGGDLSRDDEDAPGAFDGDADDLVTAEAPAPPQGERRAGGCPGFPRVHGAAACHGKQQDDSDQHPIARQSPDVRGAKAAGKPEPAGDLLRLNGMGGPLAFVSSVVAFWPGSLSGCSLAARP